MKKLIYIITLCLCICSIANAQTDNLRRKKTSTVQKSNPVPNKPKNNDIHKQQKSSPVSKVQSSVSKIEQKEEKAEKEVVQSTIKVDITSNVSARVYVDGSTYDDNLFSTLHSIVLSPGEHTITLIGDSSYKIKKETKNISDSQRSFYFLLEREQESHSTTVASNIQQPTSPTATAPSENNDFYKSQLLSAEKYSKENDLEKSIECYEKVPLHIMDNWQLTDYSMLLFLKRNFEKSLIVSKFGNNKFPRYAPLNRLTMFNQVNLKNYEDAIKYGNRLFYESDDVKISAVDHQNYADALFGIKKYDEAITTYQKIINDATANEDTKTDVYRCISDAYKSTGRYKKAIEYYDFYMKREKKITAYILSNQASNYMAYASDAYTSASEKANALSKADAIYAQIANQFPSVADFATYQRSHIPFELDPEDQSGKAKPHYEKLIEIINSKASKNTTDNNRLKECYQYMTVYYLKIANNLPKSKEFAYKLQQIDPSNELAKTIISLR